MRPVAKVFAHPSQRALARTIADHLEVPLGEAVIDAFADGERHVELAEPLWGQGAVLVVSTSPPVDERLMTLALLADAAKRAGASPIVAVVPYFGYARSERLTRLGLPIAAHVAARLIEGAGVTHLVSADLHSPAIAGFFSIPVIDVAAWPLLLARWPAGEGRVLVAPDAGGLKRVSEAAGKLGLGMAIAAKSRPRPDAPKVLHLWGEVAGREAIVLDDMITTAGTIARVGEILAERGATAIDVAATHAVMAPGAEAKLRALGVRRLVVTDTVPFAPDSPWQALEVVSLGQALAAAVAPCLWQTAEGEAPPPALGG